MGQILTLQSPGGNTIQAGVPMGSQLHRNMVAVGYRVISYVDTTDPNRVVTYVDFHTRQERRADEPESEPEVPVEDEDGGEEDDEG